MMKNTTESISGLWAELSGFTCPLQDKASLELLFKNIVSWGISDLYLQVFREGRAWYGSSLFERGCSWDPLEFALTLAKSHGVRLHAWMNALNLGRNDKSSLLTNLGLDALVTDDKGVRIDAYLENDTPPDERAKFFTLEAPGLWLDPGIPEVRTSVVSVARELASLYPQLCGIHLDFVRYPYLLPVRPGSGISWGFDFGYGERSKREFLKKKETGPLAWDNFRRENIDSLISGIKEVVGPTRILSAAVVAWPDRAYLSAFQNWRKWLLEEMLDQVCLMSYTADNELFRYLCRQAASFASDKSKVIAGIGMYKFQSEEEIRTQAKMAIDEGTSGHVVFSYGNLLERRWNISTE